MRDPDGSGLGLEKKERRQGSGFRVQEKYWRVGFTVKGSRLEKHEGFKVRG
jgi:hypothetical protein